jgi:hypothetical protein
MQFRNRGFDWIAWAFFVALPSIAFWQIATSLTEQGAASGGPMQNAAIFPRIVAWVLAGLCVVHALRLLLGRATGGAPLRGTPTTRLALIATALFLVFLLSLGLVGYYIAAPILLVALMRLFGIGWIGAVLAAVAMTLAVAFVFEGLLNVVLPLGFSKFTLFG